MPIVELKLNHKDTMTHIITINGSIIVTESYSDIVIIIRSITDQKAFIELTQIVVYPLDEDEEDEEEVIPPTYHKTLINVDQIIRILEKTNE